MQTASKHERVLFILRSIRALWKLALEHGSNWERHHGPNEKLSTIQSSLLAQCLSRLSSEWFGNTFSSQARSPRLSCPASVLPPSGWKESPSRSSFPLSTPIWALVTCNALLLSGDSFLSITCSSLGVCNDSGLQTAKAGWSIHPICCRFAFEQTKIWKVTWVGNGPSAMKLMLLGTGEEIWGCK